MGFISDLGKALEKRGFGSDQGRALWDQSFGAISKEEVKFPKVRSNSYGRSLVGSDASYKRLLQSMRSMAPGGWSDDRWEQSKHFVGIAYVAIHRICEQLSQAEFQVFKKDPHHPDGKSPVESDHPLIRLLQNPNNDDSFGDMMYGWSQQMRLTGSTLTWMVPNKLGVPYELYIIPTAMAIPQPAVNPDFPDGYYRIQPVYPYGPFTSYPTPASAVGAPIPAQWMLRFKYRHPLLRYEGYSPLTALRLHLDEIESMDRSRWYAMKRSINPSAVLNFGEMEGMMPLPEEEIERIRAEFEENQMGPENTGQLFVSTPGAKLDPWGTTPKDMEYQNGWEQLVSFALGAFGITKPAAGMIEDSSYSTLFATLKQLHLLTLEPDCTRIASQLTRHLATFFGDDLIVEIRCKRVDDHEVKAVKLNMLVSGESITKNELRKELDMPLTDEEWGDEIAGPGGSARAQQAEDQEAMAEQQQGGMPGEMPPEGGNMMDLMGGDEENMMVEEEPAEVTQTRPNTGTLGQGALGPRKSFSLNGNGRHRREKCHRS